MPGGSGLLATAEVTRDDSYWAMSNPLPDGRSEVPLAGRRLQRPSCAAWNVQSATPYSLSMSPCEEACSEPLYPAFITGTAVLTSKSSGMTVTSEPADWAPGGRRCCSELKASGGGTSDDAAQCQDSPVLQPIQVCARPVQVSFPGVR